MGVNFNEIEHTYTHDNGKVLISVTQLLTKAGLAPDYSSVNQSVLSKACEYGTFVHKELESFIKNGKIGISKELDSFIRYIDDNNVKPISSEYVVYDDNVAGTIDVTLKDKDNNHILADFKTTSTIHTETVSWQLSIYAYLLEKQEGVPVDKLQVFHFDKDGELEVKDIIRKPNEKVEELIEWYKKESGEEFGIKLLDGYQLEELYKAEYLITMLNQQIKQVEEKSKIVKEAIIKAMKENGLTRFENDNLLINLIAPVSKKTLDTKLVKEKYPDIYNECSNEKTTNESVRIKVKKNLTVQEDELYENNVLQK